MNAMIERFHKSPVGRFVRCWSELRVGEGAVLIAWQLLFSLFPLVVGLLAIMGLILRDPRTQGAVAAAIVQQFPEQAGDLVGFISETRDLGGIFGIVSILGLLWSGSTLFGIMGIVFDRFYGVRERGFLWQRLVSFAMMATYAVLISVSVGSTSITGFLAGLSDEVLSFDVPGSALVLGWLVSVASAVLMFLLLYRVVPNAALSFRDVWPGAVVAAVLFVVLTQAFPLYLHFLGSGFAAYKALGVFLLLMTWFYFLSMILCAGALLNAMLSGRAPAVASAPESSADEPTADQAARAGAGQEIVPFKVMAWAGLTAAVSSLSLIVARRLAASVWRTVAKQEPPG